MFHDLVTYDLVFSLINLSVMPAWLLLIFLPRWRGTTVIVHSMGYPLLLGTVYIVIFGLVLFAGHGAPDGGFTSIAAVRALSGSDAGVVIGWTHYLVFDLFVGAWIARDAQKRGVHHGLIIPCLFFTFMAGPVGLVMYAIIRKVTGKGGWNLLAIAD